MGRPENPGAPHDARATLIEQRTIMIGVGIDDAVANRVIAELLFLHMEDREAPATLLINSPGGRVSASFSILDTMAFVRMSIRTHVVGLAFGTAALIAASGARGQRSARDIARLGIGELWGGDDVSGAERAAAAARARRELVDLLCRATDRGPDTIAALMKSGADFSAAQAIQHGFIDAVSPAPLDTRGAPGPP